MFSDHLPKIEMPKIANLSPKAWFAIAAGLVFLCQLVALGMVADGQVKKAQLREAQSGSERLAVARCIETNSAASRNSCLQLNEAAQPSQNTGSGRRMQASADASMMDNAATSGSQFGTFMPAAFNTFATR
ncbi:MAG: hypothetical protein ABIP46_12715 [Polaromonas sp.]